MARGGDDKARGGGASSSHEEGGLGGASAVQYDPSDPRASKAARDFEAKWEAATRAFQCTGVLRAPLPLLAHEDP
eukprot:7687939-Pyramimonas_sp.AAC.1